MSEQTQTEEQGGGVVLPLAVGAAGAYGAHKVYTNGANKLAKDALLGAEGVKAELSTAAKDALATDGIHKANFETAQKLAEKDALSKISSATVTKLGEDKGFMVDLSAEGQGIGPITVKKLDGAASGLIKEGQSEPLALAKEEIAKLTEGGEKSWVAKAATRVEQDATKAVRSAETYKKAGGTVRAAFSHMSGMGKAGVIAGSAVAAVGIGKGIKNMLGGNSHTSKVEAERAAPAQGVGVGV